MPTVTVNRELLFEKIGQVFTNDEFDKLCFEFGIELDEVVETDNNSVEYKIDIPANRYDLLCVEGIAIALAVFINKKPNPRYTQDLPSNPITTFVANGTKGIRPYIVTAVLRNVSITPQVYNSIIDLQEKLHHNICRKRALVAIGVHDLDTLKPPFKYTTEPKDSISFKPLNQDRTFRANDLMEFYEKDSHLKPYLHLIKDKPLYPVIRDASGVVLSLPPIINGDHSKVSTNTKNIFIECTATDLMKANIVLDTLVTMLSEYAETKFQVEATSVVYEGSENKPKTYPELSYKMDHVDVNLANKTVGIELTADEMAKSLSRMGLRSQVVAGSNDSIFVEIPPTRHDVIHQCDIMEDVAISFGYSNIKATLPPTTAVAAQFPLNKLTSKLRECIAQAGFTEVLTFSLCSIDDECDKLNHPKEVKEPTLARIANPKSLDFQVVRNSLLPGLLKTLQANSSVALPLKLFEISDVVCLNENTDTGAKNDRHICAVHYNKTTGFETIHGLLDRCMLLLEIKFRDEYKLRAIEDPTYFPGRCAEIMLGDKVIGKMGVLHPEVTDNFGLNLLCSALEISIEDFV